MSEYQRDLEGAPTRRRLLGVGAAGAALGLATATTPAQAAEVRPTRARFKLSKDFALPKETFGVVPFNSSVFQKGNDVTLQADGKILINTSGVYEFTFSADWDANSGNDIDMRKIGLRRQAPGQGDNQEDHERLGFLNTPGSNPPAMARFQGDWTPGSLPPKGMAHIDVKVAPTGWIVAGDSAVASLTSLSLDQMSDAALTAVICHAKAIGQDLVRVTLLNPGIPTFSVPAGNLKVVAMSGAKTHGSNGDCWMVMRTATWDLNAGDRVYGTIEHKVPGTLLQATKSTYLQVDKIG